MNDFITYLNSTNNIDGNQTGTLAEAQITSKYYRKIRVRRRLGDFITNHIRHNDHYAFILTGHAGDGKTSVLIQVLTELGLLADGEMLSEQKEYDRLIYVKDMSELSRQAQTTVFAKALDTTSHSKSSILISNTGPLLKAFEDYEIRQRYISPDEFSESDRIALQSKLLKQLDNNSISPVSVCNHDVFLINVARLDNVPFSREILKNIQLPELWNDCINCPCSKQCPIYNNHRFVDKHFDRVSSFIESYYRFLYESDKRMTIRQMMGQISYALTANLTCEFIKEKYKELKTPLFYYNFANLFFGYNGINPNRDSQQIPGIQNIRELGLDQIALDVDFDLFVSENYKNYFDEEIATILDPVREMTRNYYRNSSEETYNNNNKKKTLIRQTIRRFYMFYGTVQDQEGLFNQLFGKMFSDYCNLMNSRVSRAKLNDIKNLIFSALYIKNTGFESVNDDNLYLTLRREDDIFQNVMLVLGSLSKQKIKIKQIAVDSSFEDSTSKYMLSLEIGSKDYRISLPMITYFSSLAEGSISSNNNPSLTHGIATIDTALLEEYGDEKPERAEDCELTLLINTTNGPTIKRITFDSDSISIN